VVDDDLDAAAAIERLGFVQHTAVAAWGGVCKRCRRAASGLRGWLWGN
jgi:hypothetical protein